MKPSPLDSVAATEAPSLSTADSPSTLRQQCLSYSEVLAQSLSVIAPSTVPAAILGLIFARAGNATWLSFVLGVVGLAFVALNVNQFARRSASPGSLYIYISKGLSPTLGIVGGWALLFGYALTGMSTLCGFAIIANALTERLLGVHVGVVTLFGLGAAASCYIAFNDIRLSAKTMLLCEGLSVLVILVLSALIWAKGGFAFDRAQMRLAGAKPGGILAAEVLVIFAFSGFESSTALGYEARNPLRTIPRSTIQSVLLAGGFFVATSYAVVMGFARTGRYLGDCETPLNVLADSVGFGILGTAIDIGILLSFFSCTLGSINSTARILFAMARQGVVIRSLGETHLAHRTPHVAVGLTAFLTFGIPAVLCGAGVSALDCQGYFGTLCGFGFIVVYLLISVAAPVYLASIKRLTKTAIVCAIGGVASMLLPLVGSIGIPGSTLFPPTDAVTGRLVAIFAAYMAVGLGFLLVRRARQRQAGESVQRLREIVYDPLTPVGERAMENE